MLGLAARSPTSYPAETTVPHPQSGLPSLHPLQYLPYIQFRVALPPSPTPGPLPLFRSLPRSFLSPLLEAPVVIRGTVYLSRQSSSIFTLCSVHHASIQDYHAPSPIPWRLQTLCTPYPERLLGKTCAPSYTGVPSSYWLQSSTASSRRPPAPIPIISPCPLPILGPFSYSEHSSCFFQSAPTGVPASPLWKSSNS